MRIFALTTALLALSLFVFAGCEPTNNTANNSETTNTSGDGHDHDHDHSGHDHDHDHSGHDHDHDHGEGDAHGPNGGHPLKFDAGDFSAEWTHSNDNDIIRLIFLDKAGKANKFVKADSVTMRRTKGDEEVFTLDPENATEEGMTDRFMIDSKDLNIAMSLGVTVEVKMGETVSTAVIPPHEKHDH